MASSHDGAPSLSSASSSLSDSDASRLKLCYLDRAKLFSVSSSQLSFSKLLSLVAQAFPETQNGSSPAATSWRAPPVSAHMHAGTRIELSYNDEDGDSVIIDSDESLKLAALTFQKAHMDVMKVHIQLKNHQGITSNSTYMSASGIVRPRIPCRHFQTGSCRFGSSCKFLHHSANGIKRTSSRKPAGMLLDEFEVDEWLMAQKCASEHENITYLSSQEGYDSFMQILNHPQLPQVAIDQLVGLLTRPKFRTSMLRQATDKIYNSLIGSQFLLALHLHIRTSVKPLLGCIEPYVLLCEEIMGRTSSGWKEVPLDELKSLLEDVENVSAKELSYILDRLLDHRAKKKRMEAVSEDMGALVQGSNFRDLPIIPAKEQLLSQENQSPLPVNQIGVRYCNIAAYLDTHFRLMQEDCIATLRDGIQELRKNSRDPNLHVYTNVQLAGIACANEAMVFRVSFNANARQVDWQSAKRLMFGALLCMSCDQFQTFLWAVVSNRTPEHLSKNMVDIRLLEDSDKKTLEAGTVYMMAESSAAYFEAYSHVLKNLQRPEMDSLPFQEHLISLEPHVKEPVYLKGRNRGDVYDFECAFPQMKQDLLTTQFHILQSWPEWANSLDKSQMSALKHGLTKRLALIQGPPGTGKTFIGLLIVRIMLKNLKHVTASGAIPPYRKKSESRQEEDPVGGPILVICYTNHALDQFLEGIHAHEKNIVRVGGRSKSAVLEACNLQKLLYGSRPKHGSLLDDLDRRNREAHGDKKNLEREIHECVDLVNLVYVTKESLHGIALEEQVESLFYEGCCSENVVEMWLNERERENQKTKSAKLHPVRGGARSSMMENRFEALTMEEGSGFIAPDGTLMTEDRNNIMKMITRREDKGTTEGETEESAWTEVKTKKVKPYKAPRGSNNIEDMLCKREETAVEAPRGSSSIEDIPCKGEETSVEEQVEMLKCHTDMWSLDGKARKLLHAHWINTIHQAAQEKLTVLSTEFEEACRKKLEIENEIQLSVLRTAKVVGMTTTAAARLHSVLESLQAEIVVVEEAAEVLESHVLACLTSSTKHLILIGDHLQLRPSVAVHMLAVKHKLDVSLFERLVKSGIEYVTLEVQRRMRPSISKLISGIYPMLKDHESVSAHENVKGTKSNVFFFNHVAPEEHRGDDELGKVNVDEAHLVVELCDYLLKQGYAHTDITILSMYKGQTQEIIRRLTRKVQIHHLLPVENQQKLPRVSSVDDFQGEECKIIILSLVRSNILPTAGTPGKIGFLAVSNRVCVSLSRARNGLFIFGNGELLSQKSDLWRNVIEELQKSESYGDALVLACQNHPDKETEIRKPNDFQGVKDGGCDRPCEHQLQCGHACPKRCHPDGHNKVVCPKRCPRKLPLCDHQCQSLCHGFDQCPPCYELVMKELPQCGHFANIHCSSSIDSVVCSKPCPKLLACSHKCLSTCGRACTALCRKSVERVLQCGHSVKIPCHLDPSTYKCPWPCEQILPDCQHACQGTCGACSQGKEHIPCQRKCNRTLPCGHPCSSLCHKVCPPCFLPCQKSCMHSRCPQKCGYPCVPCMEPCGWTCRHHTCRLLCHELCDRPCCNEPCEKVLSCGHQCLGFCGESCPPICRICTPGFKDTISLMMMEDFDESDRFVKLQDCGHVFEVSGLDTWMQTEQSGSDGNGISPKQCPECRRTITKSFRYGNHVKEKLRQIEDVKKRILQFDMTNEGIRFLQAKDFEAAEEKFVSAISQNQSNFDAYLGLGSALCCQSRFKEGINLFQFVVRHSPLQNAVEEVEIGQQAKQTWEMPFLQRRKQGLNAILTRTFSPKLSVQGTADKELAVKALVQWASILSKQRMFPAAVKACEIVLKEEPSNKEAEEIVQLAREHKSAMSEVVNAMMKEVGGRGHWYQCPNGHLYVVGECGGPTQVSRCPDCKATVGGQNHTPAPGNMHSSVDGSTHSAWSNQVGLGNLDFDM